MSAIKQAQEKVMANVSAGESSLVAGFDFSILITIAMKLLMEYLGNCMVTNQVAAEERVQDGFWFSYFARKAAKDAVRSKYGKHQSAREAQELLSDSIEALDVEDRKAVVAELKEVHSDAGLLI